MIALQIVFSILSTVLLGFLALKLVHVLQLGGYRAWRFARWTFSMNTRYTMILFVISLLGFGSCLALTMFLKGAWAYLGLILYFALGSWAVYLNWKTPTKVPLRYTARIIRLFVVSVVLCWGLSFAVLWFAAVWCLPLLSVILPGIVLLGCLIVWPVELLIRQIYITRATKKLFSPQYASLIRIGITGSYGKTTCKNILAAMLSQKYKVVASPASFNTPMGWSKTVLEALKPEHEVFIMEMGARRKGDIKTMVKLFRPHHGLLTGVGSAHLETFKTVENIRKEKYELINAITDGVKITNDERRMTNNELCAEMARALGVTDKQIESAIAELKPVPHRLEIIKTEHGVTIIDDSYNACPESVVAALDKLRELTTDRKAIVMTPGLVELGKAAYHENFIFGKNIASVADKVIIVNELNKTALTDGLKDGGFAIENILYARNLEDAKAMLGAKKGDVVLIANDLPDNFV